MPWGYCMLNSWHFQPQLLRDHGKVNTLWLNYCHITVLIIESLSLHKFNTSWSAILINQSKAVTIFEIKKYNYCALLLSATLKEYRFIYKHKYMYIIWWLWLRSSYNLSSSIYFYGYYRLKLLVVPSNCLYKASLVLKTTCMLNLNLYAVDVNECENKNGGCSHKCANDWGSYHCECPPGYELDLNNRTCLGK